MKNILTILIAVVLSESVYAQTVTVDVSSVCSGTTNIILEYVPAVTNALSDCITGVLWNAPFNATSMLVSAKIDPVQYAKDNELLTNVVKQLANEGHICEVFGHNWRDGRPGEGEGSPYGGFYADYHPHVMYRTCRICGVCQSQSTDNWK